MKARDAGAVLTTRVGGKNFSRRPRFADIHIFKVETLQNALFSALHSREKAGIVVKPKDTVWLPLYERSSRNDPMYAGGCLACIQMIQPFDDRPPMLERSRILVDLREHVLLSDDGISVPSRDKEVPTFAEAKKLVALATMFEKVSSTLKSMMVPLNVENEGDIGNYRTRHQEHV